MITPLTGWYLFVLGLATGMVILDMTVYRKLSPRWLRWLLLALAAFTGSRYLTMALFAHTASPQRWWFLRHCWMASSIGLTVPSVLVLDQLLRHPSWSAKKVLQYFSPFIAVYLAVIIFGRFSPSNDPSLGSLQPVLTGAWPAVIAYVQGVFVLGFAALCVLILTQVRSRRVRGAVLGLLCAHLYLGLDGVLLALGHVYFRPFLFSEIIALAAIGHAFDTALQRA